KGVAVFVDISRGGDTLERLRLSTGHLELILQEGLLTRRARAFRKTLNFDVAGLLAPVRVILGNQCCDRRLVPIELHGRINDGAGVVESLAFGDEDLHVHLTARRLVLLPALRNRDRRTVLSTKLAATNTHDVFVL